MHERVVEVELLGSYAEDVFFNTILLAAFVSHVAHMCVCVRDAVRVFLHFCLFVCVVLSFCFCLCVCACVRRFVCSCAEYRRCSGFYPEQPLLECVFA